MAKKGGGAALQIDCETEEDWEKLVERPGLIICDVYSDWCGPCTGMQGNLRKLKLDIGGDLLHIATAKSDNIQCLERFRNKSEPTWMFISDGKMIKLMFGANAPRLIATITEELNKTKHHVVREGIRFDELTDEEQQREDEETRIREEAEEREAAAKERAIRERREEVVEHLLEPLKDYIFVILFSHINNEQTSRVLEAMKEIFLTVMSKPVKTHISEENLNEMLYYQTWPMEEHVLEMLKTDEISCLLFSGVPSEDPDVTVLDNVLQRVYGKMKSPPGDEDSLAMSLQIYKSVDKQEPAPIELTEDGEEYTPDIRIAIPGIFVPENENVKVLAMRFLFSTVTMKYDLPEPEPIPPHLIIAFDASKRNEILQLAVEYPFETMRMGFFTSHDCDTAQLIAKTPEQYEKLLSRPYDAKLVIQVAKKKSEPLLSYSVLGPSYVSPNTTIGEKECKKFFPENYDNPETDIVIVDTPRRRYDIESYLEDDEGEEEEDGEYEGEEEEEEEEEDFEDTDQMGLYQDTFF